MIQPNIPDEEAKKLFTSTINTMSLPSGKNYVRLIDEPTNV